MTMTISGPVQTDEAMRAALREALDGPVSVFAFPVSVVDRLIAADLAEMSPGGALILTDAGREVAQAMTPEAKALRLAVAFGRPISEDAKRALNVVALHATDDDLVALAEEIHALSVRPTPPTPAQSHLEEWLT